MKIGDLPWRKTKECSTVEGIAPGHDSRGYSLIPALLVLYWCGKTLNDYRKRPAPFHPARVAAVSLLPMQLYG
jgi:hypothetical protein